MKLPASASRHGEWHGRSNKKKPLGAAPLPHLCFFFCVATALSAPSLAADDVPEQTTERLSPFFEDSELKGNFFYFHRNRERYRVDTDRYETILHHSTLQTNIEFNSGLIQETFGLDLGYFATTDIENSGFPVHEISFFPWDNPWSPDPSEKDARGGGSVYKAHAKIQIGDSWTKLGYFQPSGPGVLGVNWSLMPGTYLGAESVGKIGPLTVAGAYASEYKAPWFQSTYHFKKNDGVTDVAYLWSLGMRYAFDSSLTAELAYGGSQDYLKNAHLKIKYNELANKERPLYLSYQLYAMSESNDDALINDNFAGTAYQHYLSLLYQPAPWSLRTEFLHTRAPMNKSENVGYFAYRLISAYGGANGAYEPWWDSRSDWNHDKESAVFASAVRALDDLGWVGWSAGFSLVRGWGGKAYGYTETLKERAYTIDLGYKITSGRLKETLITLHYIRYDNQTDLPSWTGFKNAFQDERDIKFIVTVPWNW